jgi:hypothetical protein
MSEQVRETLFLAGITAGFCLAVYMYVDMFLGAW